jgi:hypothetical protein
MDSAGHFRASGAGTGAAVGIKIPAKSTIPALLDRHGLVERRGRVRLGAQGSALSLGQHYPQQDGRHERMHLALKKEGTKSAAANFL